jgi:hypothetical protein
MTDRYHTKTFVDIGVAGFKLDECDGNPGTTDPGSGQKVRWFFPDTAQFPSGMTGAQVCPILPMMRKADGVFARRSESPQLYL